MTTPREAEEMTTPTEMSWDYHIVAEEDQAMPDAQEDQAMPDAPVPNPASAPAEEPAWGPRIVAPADDVQPLPEPPIADQASATASASSEPAAVASTEFAGTPELRSAAAEPGTATGADTEKPSTATAPVSEHGSADASSADDEGINSGVRWHEILAMFVDDPRSSVEQAAAFAENRAEALVSSIKERQHSLLSGWQRHDAGTEELRIALQQYRLFCKCLEHLSDRN
jgi:hypothetical protein